MVSNYASPVFDTTEPRWTDSDVFAHLSSFEWELQVDWTEVVGTVTVVYTSTSSGTTADKRFVNDDLESYDDWFTCYGTTQSMMPAQPPSSAPLIYGRFAPLGIIGTITETDGGGTPLVNDVTDGNGWEVTIRRLTNAEVDADFPAEIGLREDRSGVFLATVPDGAGEFSTNLIEPPYIGDIKSIIEGGTATVTKTVNITSTGYSFSGTLTLVVTTA